MPDITYTGYALDSGSHHGLRSRLSATRFRNVRRQPSPVHWGRWTAWHPENRQRWPDWPLKRLQDKSQALYPDIVAKLGPLATPRSWGYLSQVHTQFTYYRKRSRAEPASYGSGKSLGLFVNGPMELGRHGSRLVEIEFALTPTSQVRQASSLNILGHIPYVRELPTLDPIQEIG